MESLYIAISAILFFFLLIVLYTLYYFRHEMRSLTKHKYFKKINDYALIPLLILIIFGLGFLTIYWVRSHLDFDNNGKTLKFTALGEIGDLFNGLIGPFIALLSVILFYKAYREQIRTNAKNDELRLLEYSHSRLDHLRKETTIENFELNCQIYLTANVSQSRKEMALKKILTIFHEFDNIKQIVSEMELHAPYLKDQYLMVMSNEYFAKMQDLNASIVFQAQSGNMIRITVGIEGEYNRRYREFYALLDEGGYIEY